MHEWDWRDQLLHRGITDGWPTDRRLHQMHFTVRRDANHSCVQFGDGSWRCHDLAADRRVGAGGGGAAVIQWTLVIGCV